MIDLLKDTKKIFEKWLPENENFELEKNKLPEWQADILFNGLAKLIDSTPMSTLLQALNAKLAHVFQMNRLSFETLKDKKVCPVNYYGITFLRSGGGKDIVVNTIDDYLLPRSIEKFNSIAEKKYSNLLEKIKGDADFSRKTDTARDRFIELHGPRNFNFSISDGTSEGLYADRLQYKHADFAGTFFKCSEFGSFLQSISDFRNQFLSLIIEVYDFGNNEGKTIKGNKSVEAIKGVPHSMLAYSSLEPFKDTSTYARMIENFNKGLGRRSFVCYPGNDEFRKIKSETFQELKETEKKNIDIAIPVLNHYEGFIFKALQLTETNDSNFVLKFSERAKDLILAYKYYNSNSFSDKELENLKGGFIEEIGGRYWKVQKLSCIFHVINCIKNDLEFSLSEVNETAVGQAIYQAEFFGKYFNKFYDFKNESDFMKLYFYLKKHDNKWIPTCDIRQQNFANNTYFKKWLDENLEICDEYAHKKGEQILSDKYGRNGTKYKLVRIVDIGKDEG